MIFHAIIFLCVYYYYTLTPACCVFGTASECLAPKNWLEMAKKHIEKTHFQGVYQHLGASINTGRHLIRDKDEEWHENRDVFTSRLKYTTLC